jgi:glycerophosphoryl diester phosphodiesterase
VPDRGERPGPWASGAFDVEGHRGARGLAPENILPSFLAAFEAGATGVELDVRLSADGQVVVWHDPTLQADKCRSDEGLVGARVDELTLVQLQTVDVGSITQPAFPGQRAAPGARILTLAQLLSECDGIAPDVWWTIEVKVDPTDVRERATRRQLVEGVIQTIHDAGVGDRSFVHSFDWAVLDLSRELDPSLLRSALAAVGAQVVAPHFHTCDRPFVERAHGLGLAVLPWTVNEPADLSRMLDVGVDGLVTDYPDRAVALLATT